MKNNLKIWPKEKMEHEEKTNQTEKINQEQEMNQKEKKANCKKEKGKSEERKKINKKILFFIIIAACYLPAFIAFCPVIFNYDGPDELYALANDVQPYIYTLLIRILAMISVKLFNNVDVGMCILAVIQEIAAIYAFTRMCDFIDKEFNKKWLTIMSLLFFALFPYNVLMPLMTTKDSLFTSMLILSIINIYELIKTKKAKYEKAVQLIICIIELIMALLLRTNFKYALVVCTLILVVYLLAEKIRKRKNTTDKKIVIDNNNVIDNKNTINNKIITDNQNTEKCINKSKERNLQTIVIAFIVTIIIGSIFNQILMVLLKPVKMAEREKYNIFAQSVANIINKRENDLTTEEKQKIEKYYIGGIDQIKSMYSPKLSDQIKNRVNLESVEKNRADYIKFSISLMMKYKKEAIESFINTNKGYFDFNDETFGEIYPNKINRGIFELYTVMLRPATERNLKDETNHVSSYINEKALDGMSIDTYRVHEFNLLEPVKHVYKEMFTENKVLRIPVINIIFKPALYFYLTLIALVYSIIKRKTEHVLTLILVSLYMATLLLGPCVLVRYIYPMIAILPLTISTFLKNANKNDNL